MEQTRIRSAVIFGAGEAGRRALALLQGDPSASVIAFADNNPDRQGRSFERLPVIAPDALVVNKPDVVVVASQAWADIVPQLRRLGIPRERIRLFKPGGDGLVEIPDAQQGPRILVLTDDCIAPSHGTGAVLLRHFAEYPRELLIHGYLRLKGDPFLPHSYRVAPERYGGDSSTSTSERPPLTAKAFVDHVLSTHGQVDLVYSNFFGETGLRFLAELLQHLNPSIPVVHHVHDILVEDDDVQFDTVLQQVAPRIAEFWAVGPGLGERVSRVTGRPAVPMNTFSCEITPLWKQDHRPLDASFSAVMLGNSHMPWVMDYVRRAWAEVRRIHHVPPVRWFAYPTSVVYVERAGVQIGPDIEYYGYLNNRVLHEHLCRADLAIVPFNIADEPEYAYARYSIPSRLTEFMNAGVPVFAAAGRGTEAYRFMSTHDVAECATIADIGAFTTKLLALMEDVGRRRVLGEAGRRYASTHGDVRVYRRRLFGRIAALTGTASAADTAA